jgi:hypothetical protein
LEVLVSKFLVIAIGLLLQAPGILKYQMAPGDSTAMTGGYTLSIELDGPQVIVNQLRAGNPILDLRKIRIEGTGRRTVAAGEGASTRVQFKYDNAHVEGISGTQPFKFAFDAQKPVAKTAPSLELIAWALSMDGRNYRLSDAGEYASLSTAQDASSDEAQGMLIDAPVRLPNRALAPGEQWTSDWTGAAKRAKDGARFQYRQTAKLEPAAAKSGRRRISFTTKGTLQIPGVNQGGEESVLDATGFVVLDPKAGVVSIESAGSVVSTFKSTAFKLIRRIEAKYDVK